MITEKDLQAAIAECKGVRNPTSSTCIKLAAFLTIYDHLYGEKPEEEMEDVPRYSFSSGDRISYYGESEFAQAIDGKDTQKVLKVMEEMAEAIQVLHPKLYNSVINKLKER